MSHLVSLNANRRRTGSCLGDETYIADGWDGEMFEVEMDENKTGGDEVKGDEKTPTRPHTHSLQETSCLVDKGVLIPHVSLS